MSLTVEGPVRGRSPALPPSSPPAVEHESSVNQSASHSPQRTLAHAYHLLSPEAARLTIPTTPTSRSKTRDTSSEYYTAVWGSPYERSPSSRSARTALSEQAPSEELSRSSPAPDFGLEHLVPSRLGNISFDQPNLSPLAQLTVSAQNEDEDPDVTPRSRTKRWVQLPRKEESSEKVHWWSDESAHSPSDRELESKRRKRASLSDRKGPNQKLGHRSHESNRTLDQQSFWSNLREQRTEEMSSLLASRWANTPPAEEDDVKQSVQDSSASNLHPSRWVDTPPVLNTATKRDEAGLSVSQWAATPPAMERSGEEDRGVERMVQLERGVKDNDPSMMNAEEQSAEATVPSADKSAPIVGDHASVVPASPSKSRFGPPRLKRKVTWKEKKVTIQIPDLDYEALGLAMPMSVSEAQVRLHGFEEVDNGAIGSDLAFGLGPAHVKPIFPDEAETRTESTQDRANVALPDLNKWQAYKDWLMEQKLAALGVSTGMEEPATGGAQDMSRQSSGQYPPLPFSPPLPKNTSNGLGRPAMFRGHSHTMTVATPISPLNGPHGHMHRHSTFAGPHGFPQVHQAAQQRNFSPQGQQAVQQTPIPGFQPFTPQNQFAIPGFNHAASPAYLASLRNDIGGARGPGSPLSHQFSARSPQGFSRGPAADPMPNQQGYFPSFQQPSMPNTFPPHSSNTQPEPLLPELPEEDDEEELQERPATEERLLSEPPAYLPPHKRAQINVNIAVPTPRGHRHNISEGLERDILKAEHRHEAGGRDWIEIDESSEERQTTDGAVQSSNSECESTQPEPIIGKDSVSHDRLIHGAAHSHKKSDSQFNVAAPVFKYKPAASFHPTSTTSTFGAPEAPPNEQQAHGHNRRESSGAFNVAAPMFNPTRAPAAGVSSMPRSEFSFSTDGPSFKPNAPEFELSKREEKTIVDQLPSIFGKVNVPEIVKPARRSKAVAIVRPDQSLQKFVAGSGTYLEDEDGRVVQSGDRFKRSRRAGDDADEVPMFAAMPGPSEHVLQPQHIPTEEQEPLPATDTVQASSDDEVLGKPAKFFNGVLDLTPHAATILAEAETQAPAHNHKPSSSLSALARPFAPLSVSDAEKVLPNQPKESVTSISELEEGEMEEGELKEDGDPLTTNLEDQAASLSSEPYERGVTPTIPDGLLHFDAPPSARVDHVAYAEPSYDEIDAVMRQLNDMDEDEDVLEGADVSPLSSPGAHSIPNITYPPKWSRSDAPSPSPRRQQAPMNPQGDSSFTVHDRTDSGEPPLNGWPQPIRISKAEEAPTSDWSGVFSAHDEEKIEHRGQFFDSHIENLVGRAVERRLQPLGNSLRNIQSIVDKRPISRDLAPKRSSSAIESDADDEDELSEAQRHRPTSRGRDKRIDHIKAAVVEALREQSPQRSARSLHDLQELHSLLHDMKMSFARAASASLELDDIRAVVEQVVIKQQNQALVPMAIDEGRNEQTHKREISELEGRLNETLAGALEEANLRRAVEEREADTNKMLRLAEEELKLLRDSSHDGNSRLHAAQHERQELFKRLEETEEAHRDMEEQVKNLEAENAATYATLEEYRMSSHKWRQDIDQATREREDLENMITGLGRDLDDSQDLGSSMRQRLEKLHADTATAAGQLASEKASWKAKEEDYRSRCEQLESQNSTHLRERSQFENELRNLRASIEEAIERTILDQSRISGAALDDTVRRLQHDVAEQQSLAARYERDFNDAKEAGRTEVQRTRTLMEADIEAANLQVNIVRAQLESELAKVRAELDNARGQAEDTKARHERLLEEEDNVQRETLRKVNHANSVALDEARQKHENSIRELQSAHNRALQHALEDKDRSEHFLNERLALSDAKLQHFQDKVLHLEERLEIAKSAAQAAAMSAQSKAAPAPLAAALPEKVSPQALRESILVLQEQLHERESRIDQLQQQLDKEGSVELKKRDDEIAWLRELLGERGAELTDLVNTLAQPTFDRARVRDTAIRIRANLQMEQQEKERFGQSPQFLPGQAIASLSNFATPKAVQLTSAFNKWRSTMESSSLRNEPKNNVRPRSNTPSKAPARASTMPHSNMSGLMTPPASNLRSTPSPETTRSLPAPRLHSRSERGGSMPMTETTGVENKQSSAASEAPTTRLFRLQSYDNDAEDNSVNMETFGEDEDLDIADNKPPAFRSLEAELDNAVEDDSMA